MRSPLCSTPKSQLDALPPVLSYSLIVVPLSPSEPSSSSANDESSPRNLTLPRRDLFDARYQLISEDSTDEAILKDESRQKEGGREELGFLENPSDLVPGVYEGGLKTWECALTLVECLDNVLAKGHGEAGVHTKGSRTRGKRALEVSIGLHCLNIQSQRKIMLDWLWDSDTQHVSAT